MLHSILSISKMISFALYTCKKHALQLGDGLKTTKTTTTITVCSASSHGCQLQDMADHVARENGPRPPNYVRNRADQVLKSQRKEGHDGCWETHQSSPLGRCANMRSRDKCGGAAVSKWLVREGGTEKRRHRRGTIGRSCGCEHANSTKYTRERYFLNVKRGWQSRM